MSELDTHDLAAEARSRRGKAANTRGKTTEQAVVRWLRENGFPNAERTVRTGYRTKSRVSRDLGDVDGTPGLVWQIKSRETDNVGAWMDETLQQRQAASADVGVLIVRRAGKADPGRWWAWVPLLFLHGTVGDRRTWMTPVRLELADLVTLLRSRGYGDPLIQHGENTTVTGLLIR